jgi:imidazolonepropionase-like amidohydrolase
MIGFVVDRVITSNNAEILGLSTVIVNQQTGKICNIISGHHEIEDVKTVRFPINSTILAGFIDCHVHLTIPTDEYQLDFMKSSSADKTLRALKSAQGLLQAGFTTLRSAGDSDTYFPSFAVARSINNGDFIGPTIVGAGHYISVTGGGGDINFMSPDNCRCCGADGVIADGSEQMIAAVRKEIKYGSDWIKVLATGLRSFLFLLLSKQCDVNETDNPFIAIATTLND